MKHSARKAAAAAKQLHYHLISLELLLPLKVEKTKVERQTGILRSQMAVLFTEILIETSRDGEESILPIDN